MLPWKYMFDYSDLLLAQIIPINMIITFLNSLERQRVCTHFREHTHSPQKCYWDLSLPPTLTSLSRIKASTPERYILSPDGLPAREGEDLIELKLMHTSNNRRHSEFSLI